MNTQCFMVRWKTELNPGRPFYEGEVEVFGQDIADAEHKARSKVARNMALDRSQVLIVDVIHIAQ